jgi:ArsR family transcriptional regulator
MTVDVDAPREVELLRIVAEPVRWRILQLLAREELCVCHLVDELALPQPLVSHHLRTLRHAHLVETERHRYWTYYRLRPGALAPLAHAVASIADAPPTSADRRRPCC